jgi:hypothetical protein
MPCFTPPHEQCGHKRDEISEAVCDAIGKIKALESKCVYFKDKSDQATRLLCEVMKNAIIPNISIELAKWWDQHQKWDKKK